MNRKQLLIGVLGAGLLAAPAMADDACKAPMSTWQSRHAVAEKARSMGWKVDRIRTDDGCYKVYGHDPQGRRIVAEFDPASLELIEIEGQNDPDEHAKPGENGAVEGDD